MFRTIGARLTALATGITLAVTLLVSTAQYLGIRQSLYREVDAFLAGEVTEFAAILSSAGSDLEDVQRRIRAEVGSRHRGDLTFRLLDETGRVLLTSDALHRLPEHWPVPEQPLAQILFRTESGSELASHTRTASQLIEIDGSKRIVQATYLLDQVNSSLTHFLRVSSLSLVAAAAVALLGGRILASRSLRPVASMVSAARSIRVGTLGQRLDRTGSADELDLLAATFNDMFQRLENQVAQIRQFTADAAHELRTPLAVLRGNAEVLLSGKHSMEELQDWVAESIDEYRRLGRIADDLLLLARADAGREIIRRSNLRLDHAVADVVDLFEPLAEEQGIKLEFSVNEEVWTNGDADRLRQMLGNLIDNSLKFTSAGGRVSVSLGVDNGTAELIVQDTGVGIPSEHLPHIFDRFYRVDRARSASSGTGLGLAISRTIVDGHLGRIQIESALGKGTLVRVMLPTVHSVETTSG